MKRDEVQITVETAAGPKTMTILSDVTVDDLVRVMLKTYVTEARLGIAYASPFGREIRDAVTRTLTATRA